MKPVKRKRFLKPSYPIKKIRLSVMNAHLICGLCGGYLINATSITQCMHSFCRTCILKHFQQERSCPLCLSMVNECQPQNALAYDPILQKLVYKMVPGLLSMVMKSIRSFYQGLPFCRQSSHETVSSEATIESTSSEQPSESERWCLLREAEPISICLSHVTFSYLSSGATTDNSIALKHKTSTASPISPQEDRSQSSTDMKSVSSGSVSHCLEDIYLLCPGNVSVNQLLKLIRLKYDLNSEHEVVLCLGMDFLEPTHSLIELAYMYSWDRQKIMQFAFVIIPDCSLSEQ